MRYLDKSGLQYFGQKIKAALNGKSDNNHNHNANYAPLSHSNDGNIHVTSAQKTDWNSKAAKPTVLYDYYIGTNTNFTLSKSAANYTYLQIFYIGEETSPQSVTIYMPNRHQIKLGYFEADNINMYYKFGRVDINETSVTWITNGHGWIPVGGANNTDTTSKPLRIQRVLGWN